MTKVKAGIAMAIALLAVCSWLPAQTKPADGLVYSLDQFGPVGTADDAGKTCQKATADILAAGGGILLVPAQTAADWLPQNNSQEEVRTPPAPAPASSWHVGGGVTIVDARGMSPKILPPQLSGLEINRSVDLPPGESLGYEEDATLLKLHNSILRGTSSYHELVQFGVLAGKDRKFYVSSIRGVFPGQYLNSYSGAVQRLFVKSTGYKKEANLWYFVADTDHDIAKGTWLANKNHAVGVDFQTDSHAENQTFDVRVAGHDYSQGDYSVIDGRLAYQGDCYSVDGGENAVVYGVTVASEIGVFRASVQAWHPDTGVLRFFGPGHPSDPGNTNGYVQTGGHTIKRVGCADCPNMMAEGNGGVLGNGRPIINMNQSKWITNGTVCIVAPATWMENPDNKESPVFQGQRYPTTVKPGKGLDMGGLIHFSADAPVTADAVGRYFAVDEPDEAVTTIADPLGVLGGGNKLRRWYLIDSVTNNVDGTKDIRIIRYWWGAKSMGAPTLYKPENYSSDGHVKPLHYVIAPGANAYDVSEAVHGAPNIIRVVTTSFTGTPVDFAPDDPIEQAIGPDPFKPIPFRALVTDSIPGVFPAPIFDVSNQGLVMRDSVWWIHGGTSGSVTNDIATHYDRQPSWDKLLRIDAPCNTGIRFGADVSDAAILFAQPNNREQPIKWYYGTETNQPPKVAALTVSRTTGEFNFTGPIAVTGLSAGGDKPARNLRGLGVAVKGGATTASVTFPVAEADDQYGVFIEQSWLGNRAIVKKEAQGFTVQFEKPAPDGAKFDWLIVR